MQAAYLLWSTLQRRQLFFTSNTPAALLTDFLLNVGSILFAITLYSSHALLLLGLILSPAFLLIAFPSQQDLRKPSKKAPNATTIPGGKPSSNALPVRPFITAYRGAMMIVTCLSILAVDFRVFPRRFAKTENWGTSLMDIGVGSFVFSAGIIAARPILLQYLSSKSEQNIANRLWHSLRHALPLLVLGFARLYSVKGLDYAEHVTEYGVHWNFFFTLALLPPSVALLSAIPFFARLVLPLALLIACTYQICLESTDLKAYIMTSPRGTDLLSQNREGIFSFAGYLTIFLAGQGLGLEILPNKRQSQPVAWIRRRNLLATILFLGLISGFLYALTSNYTWGQNIPVSRRLANLPYALWIIATNCFLLLLFALVETICFPAVFRSSGEKSGTDDERKAIEFATSKVLGAFNKNGLAIFLLANLGTGAVNLGVDTLGAGPAKSMAILVTYSGMITAIAVALEHFGFSIRL